MVQKLQNINQLPLFISFQVLTKGNIYYTASAGLKRGDMFSFVIKFVVVAIFLFPGTSEAYLDPGTGSFVFQMLIAAGLGGLYAIKTFWGNIKTFFKKDNK